MTEWAATGPSTTGWQAVTPGAVVTESLLTQVQNEAAAAALSADAAAASEVAAAVSAAAAAVSASAASASATAAAGSAADALSYANQALIAAASVNPIPAGGTTGQSLVKNSSANYDYAWATVSGGGGGGGLIDGDYGDITVSGSASVFTIDNGVITNAKVSASAAIAYSKLNLTGAILNADLAGSIAYSKLSLTGAITNADLAGSIADTKLSTISTTNKVSNSATTATSANTPSAIVARDASGNFTAGVITATTFSGGGGSLTGLNATQLTTGTVPDARFPSTLPALNGSLLTTLNGSAITSGTVPAANLGSGTSISTKFLRGDNTWQTISGGGDALTSGNLGQFAATTSAQLAGVISDETGTGALVFATSPTLVTPVLGTPASGNLSNCTALNATQLTTGTVPDARFPATLPALNGSALTALNATNISSGTLNAARLPATAALTSGNLSQFAATTSAQLAGVISDETGTGALVFGTNPTLNGATLSGAIVGADQEVRAVTHRDTAYYRSAPTISSGAITFDYTAGPFFSVALNANITSITLSNPPASGTVGVITIRFTADGTVRTITWPASVRWGTAGAPSAMTGTNGKVDYVQLITVDGGTTWDAFLNGQNF